MAMQDEIKIISTEEAIKSLNILENKLKELDAQFTTIVNKFEKGFKPVKLSDYKNAIKNENDYANTVKQNADNYIKTAYEKREKEKQIESKKQAEINKAFAQQEEKTKKEIALKDKLIQKEIEVGQKEIETQKKKEQAYTKLLATYKKAQQGLKDLIVESEKAGNSSVLFSSKITKAKEELLKLNKELLSAEYNTKKYNVGASSLATPVLLYAEAQKKATQATKEANAEKAKSNAIISKQMTGQMIESVNAIGKPSESLKRMNDYYRDLEKTSVQEAKSAMANEKLAGAYNQLSIAREKAKTKLQDLIASEKASNSEIRKAQQEFDVLNKKVAAADKAVGRFSDANRKINGLTQSVTNLMTAFGVSTGIYLFVDLVKSIFNTSLALEEMNLSLNAVSGSLEKFEENSSFLGRISKSYGADLEKITRAFVQFYASAKDKTSEREIKNIFESITKSGAFLGLSMERQERGFLALQQMMSKGTVMAEELRGQLSEALPNAVGIMTKAYQKLHPELKVTEKFFLEQVKAGTVLSAEILPEYAKQLEISLGINSSKKVDTARVLLKRLELGWVDLVTAIKESNLGDVSGQTLKGLSINVDRFFNWAKRKFQNLGQIAEEEMNKGMEIGRESAEEEIYDEPVDKRLQKAREQIREGQKEYLKEKNALDANRRNLGFVPRGKVNDEERKYLEQQIELGAKEVGFWKGYIKQSAEIIKELKTKKIEPTKPKLGSEDKGSIDRTRKRVDFTNFSEIDLQIAQLNKEKAIINDRMNNESVTFKERLELRSQFSRKSIEILDLELLKEKKVIEQKAEQDRIQNKQTRIDNLNNKNLSKEELAKSEREYAENVTEINKRLINDLAKADVEHSDKIRNVLDEDFKYYKAIQEKKRDLIRDTAKIQREIEKENLSRIINNDIEGTFFSFNARNVAQERYIELLHEEAEAKKLIGIAEANGDPLKKAKVLAEYEKDLNNIKNIQTVAEKAKIEIDKLINSFSSDFIKNSLDTLKMPSLNKFLNFDKNGLSEFNKIMNLINNKTTTTTKKMAVSFQMVGDVFQEVMGLMNELSQSRFEAEQARIEEDKIKMEEQYKIASDFTNGNAEAQRRVDEEYERRKKEMAKREKELAKKKFNENKKIAMANILIDTAQAVVSVLAHEKKGLIGKGLAAYIIGAMGLAQLAIVASQKMPQYKDGTLNHKGGLALVNDGSGSNYQETIITPDGSMIRPKDRNVVMDLPKGTQVYNHEQFQRHLNNISQEQVNYTNVNGGVSFAEMDILLGKHIASQTHVSNQFSGGELVEFVNRKGNIVKRTASRGAGIGIRFN